MCSDKISKPFGSVRSKNAEAVCPAHVYQPALNPDRW